MKVLGLDPSLTNFGWAVHDTEAKSVAACPERGRFQTSSKQLFVDRYIQMRDHVLSLVKRLGVTRVGCEYPIFNELWSEGMYGLFLYTCEALRIAEVDLVFFSPSQIKAHGRAFLDRPKIAGKLWKMGKPDMVEAARDATGGKGRWNHNEADAYWVARTAARFWQHLDGVVGEDELTRDERKQFRTIHIYKRGKRAGQTVKKGILYREDERFFRWTRNDKPMADNTDTTTSVPKTPLTPPVKAAPKKASKAAARATAAKRKKSPTKKKKSAKPTQSMLANVRSIVKEVLKDDDPGVTVDSNQLTESRPHITSGSVVIDYLIGGSLNKHGVPPCPGWPKGMISNIFGHESSGKTTVALEAAAAVCDRGGLVCFIDWEHAISLDYASALGCPVDDPDRFYLVQPNTLEAGLSVLFACAQAGVDLIILDSVGAGVPKAIRGQALEDKGSLGRVGLVAAKWSNVLPQLAADICKSGSHVMGLSQLRKKINTGGFGGDGSTHQGGECWKYYSHVRMSFRRVKSLKTKDYDALTHKQVERFTSAVIRATVKKSKVSNSQQREADFHITFGEGIDNVRDLIAVGSAHGIVNKSGTWYAFEMADGTAVRSQGALSFKDDLLETPGAYDELAERVVAAIRAGGKGSILDVKDDEDNVDEALGFVTD